MSEARLKALVVGMGALIAIGFAVIAGTIAWRLAGPAPPRAAIALDLPDGAAPVETSLDGNRLALRLDTPDGPRILVIDLATGARVATVEIAP